MAAITAYKADTRHPILLTRELAELEQIMMDREGFESHSEAHNSSIRHWARSQQPHHITGNWMVRSPRLRSQIYHDCLRLLKSGKGQNGAWFEGVLRNLITRIHDRTDNPLDDLPRPAVATEKADQSRTLVLNPFLAKIEEILMLRERYASPAQFYISSLCLYSVLQMSHARTSAIAALPPAERAEEDRQLLIYVATRTPPQGSWIVRRIEELILEIAGPGAERPTVAEILNRISDETIKALRAFS